MLIIASEHHSMVLNTRYQTSVALWKDWLTSWNPGTWILSRRPWCRWKIYFGGTCRFYRNHLFNPSNWSKRTMSHWYTVLDWHHRPVCSNLNLFFPCARYPDMSEVCLPSLNEINPDRLDQTSAKSAFVWILGQHGDNIKVTWRALQHMFRLCAIFCNRNNLWSPV